MKIRTSTAASRRYSLAIWRKDSPILNKALESRACANFSPKLRLDLYIGPNARFASHQIVMDFDYCELKQDISAACWRSF